MTPQSTQSDTLSTMLAGRWEQAGLKLATLADAFPEKNFESKPVDGACTLGDVLRHVAFWNQFVADSVRGRKANETSNELPRAEYPTKARIIDALKSSTTEAASALKECSTGLAQETAEMVVSFLEHTSEHYGQLVVYARLQGIVPPASRTAN